MISSRRSEKPAPIPSGEICPSCGGPVASRPAHPYPVLAQALFGASFIAFLILLDSLKEHRAWIWAWSTIQIGLGVWLVRGRLRASRRVYRCIRCGRDLG